MNNKYPIRCLLVVITLILIIIMFSGCSESPEPENAFTKALHSLPIEAKEDRVITIIDYEKWRQVNGISIYDDNNQRINREVYLEILYDLADKNSLFMDNIFRFSSEWTGNFQNISSSPIQDETIGYEVTDVDTEINNIFFVSSSEVFDYGMKMDIMIAASGEFNTQSTEDALSNRDEWSSRLKDNYTTEEYKDITIHSWGDSQEFDLHDRLGPPHLNNIGQAWPVAVTDGKLFIGITVDDIKSIIDSNQKKELSLADIPEYVLVANSLYDLGSVCALIADESLVSEVLTSPLLFGPTDLGPELTDFITAGIGLGKDEKSEYMALVLVYENRTAAEQGVSMLEQKVEVFNELCEILDNEIALIYDSEINIDNEVLLAKLYSDSRTLWYWWFFDRWWRMHL